MDLNQDEAVLDGLSETAGTFLGEHFDYKAKTVSVSAKTIAKVQLCRDRVAAGAALTAKQYAAHIALLFYASSTLDIHLGCYFNALRCYRTFSANVATCRYINDELDRRSSSQPTTTNPVKRRRGYRSIDDSDYRCFQLAIDARSGSALTHSEPWQSREVHLMGESAVSEPEALWRSICRFARPTERRIRDHQLLVAPSKRGYAAGWNPNLLLLRMHRAYPNTTFDVQHIAGVINPADKASRGTDVWDWAAIQQAADATGILEGSAQSADKTRPPPFMV